MDVRRRAAHLVLEGGLSVSSAARECGLSRPTVRLWVSRAEGEGLLGLAERSRRPAKLRGGVPEELVEKVLEAKARFPVWGAKKLVAHLWPAGAPICVRTADRILARHGLVSKPGAAAQPLQRFEREHPNELWQMDFKGLGGPRISYSPLSVIDDATRFCVAFVPVGSHTGEAIWKELWELFGVYGVPQAVLTDNEGCFAATQGYGPSLLETRLWRLGVRTTQGRPAHPQTQGKVERFHRTVQLELGSAVRQPSADAARELYDGFVLRYNWIRPHEAIGMKVPGELYRPSAKARPPKLPEAAILGQARKVDAAGKFCYKGKEHRAGCGLYGQYVDVRDDRVYYAQVLIGPLSELRV